jgi:hypothetical protein
MRANPLPTAETLGTGLIDPARLVNSEGIDGYRGFLAFSEFDVPYVPKSEFLGISVINRATQIVKNPVHESLECTYMSCVCALSAS